MARVPALLVLLFALGCTDAADKAQKAEAVARQGGPLPMGEHAGRGITAAPDRARVKLDLTMIRGALIQYQRLHEGQNPGAISDLEQIQRLFYPDEYEYDQAAGTVKSATYPDL